MDNGGLNRNLLRPSVMISPGHCFISAGLTVAHEFCKGRMMIVLFECPKTCQISQRQKFVMERASR